MRSRSFYDRDSTLAVIDTIKTRITERAKQNKETEIIFYDVSGAKPKSNSTLSSRTIKLLLLLLLIYMLWSENPT